MSERTSKQQTTLSSDIAIEAAFERAGAYLAGCKRVAVRIPSGESPDDRVLEVGYNGTMFLLRRGETLEVPEPIYEVLRDAGLCA